MLPQRVGSGCGHFGRGQLCVPLGLHSQFPQRTQLSRTPREDGVIGTARLFSPPGWILVPGGD